jgi:hypothetical protein
MPRLTKSFGSIVGMESPPRWSTFEWLHVLSSQRASNVYTAYLSIRLRNQWRSEQSRHLSRRPEVTLFGRATE